jgi:hypothetical protein
MQNKEHYSLYPSAYAMPEINVIEHATVFKMNVRDCVEELDTDVRTTSELIL